MTYNTSAVKVLLAKCIVGLSVFCGGALVSTALIIAIAHNPVVFLFASGSVLFSAALVWAMSVLY